MSKKANIEAEALDWFTLMRSGDTDPEIRSQFEAWLHADRSNKLAYRELEQLYRDLDYVAVEAQINVGEETRRKSQHSFSQRRNSTNTLLGLAAAACILVFAFHFSINSAQIDLQSPTIDHNPMATQTGETKEVILEDGTIVTLGAKSEISVKLTDTARIVELLAGEAFFDVYADPEKPFFVASQDTLVRVVGTQFDVKRSAEVVHVSVLEGTVEVMKSEFSPQNSDHIPIPETDQKRVLTAGQRVSSARRVSLPDIEVIEQVVPGSWRDGHLIYEDASLAEIVADLNRYSNKRIILQSSDVGDYRSTLAFRISDMDTVLTAIEAIHPVKVVSGQSGELLIERAH